MSKKSELLIRAFDKLGKSIVEALAILDAEDSEEEIENLRHENIELKKYLKLVVEALDRELGINSEYDDEVEKLIGDHDGH